jgi:hypothetical protein
MLDISPGSSRCKKDQSHAAKSLTGMIVALAFVQSSGKRETVKQKELYKCIDIYLLYSYVQKHAYYNVRD